MSEEAGFQNGAPPRTLSSVQRRAFLSFSSRTACLSASLFSVSSMATALCSARSLSSAAVRSVRAAWAPRWASARPAVRCRRACRTDGRTDRRTGAEGSSGQWAGRRFGRGLVDSLAMVCPCGETVLSLRCGRTTFSFTKVTYYIYMYLS